MRISSVSTTAALSGENVTVKRDMPLAQPSLRRASTSASLRYRHVQPTTRQVEPSRQRLIEVEVKRRVVEEINRAGPLHEQLEDAVLSPKILRVLADRIGGALSARIGLERYRRGV